MSIKNAAFLISIGRKICYVGTRLNGAITIPIKGRIIGTLSQTLGSVVGIVNVAIPIAVSLHA